MGQVTCSIFSVVFRAYLNIAMKYNTKLFHLYFYVHTANTHLLSCYILGEFPKGVENMCSNIVIEDLLEPRRPGLRGIKRRIQFEEDEEEKKDPYDDGDDDQLDPDFNPNKELLAAPTAFFNDSDFLIEETEEVEDCANAAENAVKKKRYRTLKNQMINNKNKHPFIADFSCQCKNKCMENFSIELRNKIYEGFWQIDRHHQRLWLSTKIVEKPALRRLQDGRRKNTRVFFLPAHNDGDPNTNNSVFKVCQKFFLFTLGFKSDTILKTIISATKDNDGNKLLTPVADKRGTHLNPHKKDRNLIETHILSFNPKQAHYRRYHAPNRKYLPSDLSIKVMHEDFTLKYPDEKVLYETYRQVLSVMNIGFTEDAAEKCGTCVEYDMNSTPENTLLKDMHLLKVFLNENVLLLVYNFNSSNMMIIINFKKIILILIFMF